MQSVQSSSEPWPRHWIRKRESRGEATVASPRDTLFILFSKWLRARTAVRIPGRFDANTTDIVPLFAFLLNGFRILGGDWIGFRGRLGP